MNFPCRSNILKRCVLNRQSVLSLFFNQQVYNSSECKRAVTEAEKIIGYPTSFLNLRWLLSDEVANVALHLRKLVGTNHPLLKTAKNLLLQNDTPSWGLIVLLMSKAGGQCSTFSTIDKDITAGILHSQRILAEVTEMIRSSNMLHQCVVKINSSIENEDNMNFANKISLLGGDCLLSRNFQELANLGNNELNELMSSALRDLAENEFIGPRDNKNGPLPAKPRKNNADVDVFYEYTTKPFPIDNVLGNAKAEWTLRNVLGGGSLLGKACQGTLKLAGFSDAFQRVGYRFGRNFALTYQAYKDMESFSEDEFSLVSAPVLFHLQHDPSFYVIFEHMIDSEAIIDYDHVRKIVINGPGLESTRHLQQEYLHLTLESLYEFPRCDGRTALENILNEMIFSNV